MPAIPHRPLQTLLHSNLLMALSKNQLLFKCPAGTTIPTYTFRLLRRISFAPHPDQCLIKNPRNSSSKALFFAMKSSRVQSPGPLVPSRIVHVASVEEDTSFAKRVAMMKLKLEQAEIRCASFEPGQYSSMICPKCEGGTSKERSFSLFIREDWGLAMWSCFRAKCGWSGSIEASGKNKDNRAGPSQSSKVKEHRVITEADLLLEPLSNELVEYFSARKISAETLRRNAVMQRRAHGQVVIAFTYRRNGALVSCKYRDVNKNFWQERGTEKIFYGVDDVKRASDIIIVEGEIDKLSMEEAGYLNCVSVPDGAPSQVAKEIPNEGQDNKFRYLWNCKQYLDQASRIILATDGDRPGQALAEELARRLGKERCWRVQWPMKNANEVCKDANEVLMHLGPDALKEVIAKAELYPIRGLFTFSDFFNDIDTYYSGNLDHDHVVSTGWSGVDEFYKVIPGELTVVTGVPNSGKSEWIDALLCNINRNEGWKFVLCSMENKVREHARKLLEKHIKKPFLNSRYAESAERMTVEELEKGKEWLNDTFHLIRCDDDCLPSIQWVLTLAKAAVMRYGVRGLVIDPYNELDHQRPTNQTETEYVSQMLTKIKRFAHHHSCHVWFVAHPKQLQHWGGGPPNMYDISGSAHFINKCDNGIVIHRNRDEKVGPIDRVQVHVRKVRNKVAGGIGDAFLSYDRVTGEFLDVKEE
ncbi:twinkle homolog protein, chloroplastic/mitochondrial [Dioscorea cayenensis subsp. rotundata]|uniref:Twinkle homolog protein, chloroplastic/mitochondrial n=1 Tax=Dioscorea cayennensis subsp. rotundata TaxID=55577 RepID=A0AB40AKE2_DIOCR|nr:twinkle homolog protein, chloroplastic/mitochondrial [Dioscorea cayenensis subsp. rotundata]